MRRTQGKRKANLNPSHCDRRSDSPALFPLHLPLRLTAHASTRCTVEYRLSLTFVQVRLADCVPRARARQATTTRVVVRSLRRAARAVFSSSSSTPTLRLALRAPPLRAPGPPITHPLRRASISRTSVPAAAVASTLALATAMPTLAKPLPHGEAALGAARPHLKPRLPWVHHPTRAVPVFGGAACVTIRLQHFLRICVEADTPTWRVYAIGVLIRASELELGRWIPRLLDPGTRTHLQRQPCAQTAVRTGAPTPKKGVRRRPSSPARYAARSQAWAERSTAKRQGLASGAGAWWE
ncbi:hypothetical protein B0H14DRAFT_3508201 [Mycena olivaceomarginata]|nr:hypothetical protein B0H14DRAFT_3508201 [Mycena olivaceomarginata]